MLALSTSASDSFAMKLCYRRCLLLASTVFRATAFCPHYTPSSSGFALWALDDLESQALGAIYDIEGASELKLQELQTAGVSMTTSMRNLRIQHESDLKEKDDLIQSLTNDINEIQKQIKYSKVAYKFLRHYVETGNLELRVCDDAYAEKYAQDQKAMLVISSDFNKSFDKDLFRSCFAKYGFEAVDLRDFPRNYMSRTTIQLKLVSLESSTDVDDTGEQV